MKPGTHRSVIKELFNLLINPSSHDFALRWHRDDVPETAAEEEEQLALEIRHYGVSKPNGSLVNVLDQYCLAGAMEHVSQSISTMGTH